MYWLLKRIRKNKKKEEEEKRKKEKKGENWAKVKVTQQTRNILSNILRLIKKIIKYDHSKIFHIHGEAKVFDMF